jgi:PhoH-like ATPase
VPVIVVTKDINLRIRADAVGVRAEDYETDRVLLSYLYSGQIELPISADELTQFQQAGTLRVPAGTQVFPNQYVLMRVDGGSGGSALGRVDAECANVGPIVESRDGLGGIKPRNKEQYFAFDALLDDRIQLVTLMGKAGTGKTLLAIAAGMHQTLRRKHYRHLLVCRPIFPVGRDLGFLPGDVEQKLDPWMKPVVDAIEFLLDAGGMIKGHADCQALLHSGLIEIQPLTYIRGRSISKRFVVIDEAQNLTPLEVKTVITRIGLGAKVVLTGDPYQIDNPYVDADSNGFTYLVNRFKNQPVAAHIELCKGERSELAELAANLL